MVKYVGNMHGDETVGREVLLALAEYLVKNYGVVERVTDLLNSTEVGRLLVRFPNSLGLYTRGSGNLPRRLAIAVFYPSKRFICCQP